MRGCSLQNSTSTVYSFKKEKKITAHPNPAISASASASASAAVVGFLIAYSSGSSGGMFSSLSSFQSLFRVFVMETFFSESITFFPGVFQLDGWLKYFLSLKNIYRAKLDRYPIENNKFFKTAQSGELKSIPLPTYLPTYLPIYHLPR
jgi:hypothetical protein